MSTAKTGGLKRGRRRGREQPRIRPVDPQVLTEVRAVLGDAPRRPNLLIEHLHRLHDHAGHLSTAVLTAPAAEMKMAMAEVYEVASFYAHFDVVDDGQRPPPAKTVRICDGVSCMLAGAETLIAEVRQTAGPDVRVVRAPCIGACDQVRVSTRRGSIELMARADHHVPLGLVFVPFCFFEAPADILTNPALDPFGKIPELKFAIAQVEPCHAAAAE